MIQFYETKISQKILKIEWFWDIVGIEIALFSLILHLIYIVRQTFWQVYEKRVCHLFYIFKMSNIYQL